MSTKQWTFENGAGIALLQTAEFSPISVTPHHARHVMGGSYFVLKHLADETEVIVALYYHCAKEYQSP
eukprot:6018078-Ditylum_brightwellii.AAC.1